MRNDTAIKILLVLSAFTLGMSGTLYLLRDHIDPPVVCEANATRSITTPLDPGPVYAYTSCEFGHFGSGRPAFVTVVD
jgi:hypothetical protein